MDRGLQRTNIIIVGPETGVIGGQRARWAAAEDNLGVDAPFELAPDATTPELQLGRMTIGDFAHFCEFLIAMTAQG